MISIEIAYARPNKQIIIPLQIADGTTVETAIKLSGVLQRFPEIDLSSEKIGIFSKIVSLSETLNAGDRIEIYRPLKIDPKQARLLRAAKKYKKI